MDALYRDLALPPEPMHFSTFLSHGGTGLITCRMDRGQVSALPESTKEAMVKWALEAGPRAGADRGATVPLAGPQADLARSILADIEAAKQVATPDTYHVWSDGLRRLEAGELVGHLDRFKLLMTMLRSGWDDDQVHASFSKSPKYKRDITDRHLQYCKRKYL